MSNHDDYLRDLQIAHFARQLATILDEYYSKEDNFWAAEIANYPNLQDEFTTYSEYKSLQAIAAMSLPFIGTDFQFPYPNEQSNFVEGDGSTVGSVMLLDTHWNNGTDTAQAIESWVKTLGV